MMNKEKKKLKAERLKSFQKFNHLSDDEMALIAILLLLVLM